MKKFNWLTVFLVILLFACEKEVTVTPPTILSIWSSASVGDTVAFRVEEYASIDGVRITADYYKWSVTNAQEEVIDDDFPDTEEMVWIPKQSGYFLIKVTIGYDGNKSTTALREITIFESKSSLQNKLIGHWKGVGMRDGGGEWGIELFIDSNKHYNGKADFYGFEPYCEKGVFNMGRLDYYHGPVNGIGSYQDSCGVPGNIACQQFIVNEIRQNKGFGTIKVGSEYVYTDITYNSCYDAFFSNLTVDNDVLYFELPDLYKSVIQLNRQK